MTMKRTVLLLTPFLFSAACSVTSPSDLVTSSSDPKEGVGPVIAHYTLTSEDGNPPPCCASDSAGVRITVVGGALTFHGPADYRDTVFTPAGPASAACRYPPRQHALPAAPMRSWRVCPDRDPPARPRGWLVHHRQHGGFFRDLQRKARYHRSRRLAYPEVVHGVCHRADGSRDSTDPSVPLRPRKLTSS